MSWELGGKVGILCTETRNQAKEMERTMNKKKEFQKYLLKQSMIGLGLANGLLTAVVFYIKLHTNFETYDCMALARELVITSVVIGLSVAIIGRLFAQKDMKKGVITSFKEENLISRLIPDHKWIQVLVITVLTVVAAIFLCSLLVLIQGTGMCQLRVFLIDTVIIGTILSAFAAVLSIDKTVHSVA